MTARLEAGTKSTIENGTLQIVQGPRHVRIDRAIPFLQRGSHPLDLLPHGDDRE
jgi:hypothetical protein